jgi:deoxyribodipyrimidine photo-lyase
VNPTPSIVWLRLDLRLADHPALQAAAKRGGPVVPAFVWGPEEEGAWPPGSASRWWLHQSLGRLGEDFRAVGVELVLRRGESLAELQSLASETGATAVFFNRRHEPAVVARDARVQVALRAAGLEVGSFNGALLHEPGTIRNQSGRPRCRWRRSNWSQNTPGPAACGQPGSLGVRAQPVN